MTEREKLLKEINDFYDNGYQMAMKGTQTELGMFSGSVKGVFKKRPSGIGYLLTDDGTLIKDDFDDSSFNYIGVECTKNEYIKNFKKGVLDGRIYTKEKIILKNGCFVGNVNMMTGEYKGEYLDDSGTIYSGVFSSKTFTIMMRIGESMITSSDEKNVFTVSYPNGEKYVGLLKNGGKISEEEFSSNDINSKGDRIDKKYGCFYIGEHVDGKRQGEGILRFPNHDRYVGHFFNDLQNGKGVIDYHNGDRYEGNFVDGKKQGKGIFTWENNDRYEGEFLDDKINGKGVFYLNNGIVLYGEFKDGKRNGLCAYIDPSRDYFEYGYNKDGNLDGLVYIHEQNQSYEAEVKNNKIVKKGNFGLKKLWKNEIKKLEKELDERKILKCQLPIVME